tara:strand:- start:1110 stop:1577 length:468 start_codon:yes stop_codon:yes gene_type:complete
LAKDKGTKHLLKDDYRFSSKLISKFINKVMLDGKKSIAEKIVYSSLDKLSKEVNEDALSAFMTAISNVSPKMEVKSKRVGGSTYQVPIPVSEDRAQSHAINWIIKYSRSKKGKSMTDCLTQELVDAYNNVGATAKKRDDTHKMAEANKAFAHFRW